MGRSQTAAGVREECGYRKQMRPEAMMINTKLIRRGFPILLAVMALPAGAQSFRVQCPTSTITHPTAANAEPLYTAPTTLTLDPVKKFLAPTANVNGAIKCQQISGGDGYSTMGDGTQTYMFSFGPLSGLTDISQRPAGHAVPERLQCPRFLLSPVWCPVILPRRSPGMPRVPTTVPWDWP